MSSDERVARRRATRYLAGAALLALGAALAAAGAGDGRPGAGAPPPVPAPADAPPVLLVSIDTLRADHLGIYGYPRPTSPRIDAFFSGARIYEAAYAAESYTAPSVVSMLTGLLPQQHGVRLLYQKLSPDVVTVADLLGGAGYQTAAVVSNIVLTAEAIGLDTRFDELAEGAAQVAEVEVGGLIVFSDREGCPHVDCFWIGL